MKMEKLFKKQNPTNHKYGFVDAKGDIVVPYVYSNVGVWSDGLIYVDRIKWKGFLDENADEVISLVGYQIDDPYSACFRDGICQVSKLLGSRLRYGYIDRRGNEIIPVIYDRCEMVVPGAFLIVNNTNAEVRFSNGNVISLRQYVQVGDVFQKGLIAVCMEAKYGQLLWGCIDCYGNMVIPALYDSINSGYDDEIMAVKNGINGCINEYGVFKQSVDTNKKDRFDEFCDKASSISKYAYMISKLLGF